MAFMSVQLPKEQFASLQPAPSTSSFKQRIEASPNLSKYSLLRQATTHPFKILSGSSCDKNFRTSKSKKNPYSSRKYFLIGEGIALKYEATTINDYCTKGA